MAANYSSSNRTTLAILCLAAAVYTLPWLGALEFFRHTEADRSLIAWEMATRGDWLVPHLLGDTYLTKPPLYYWIMAIVFKIFGLGEWQARLPSALAAIVLLSSTFLFLLRIGCEQSFALAAALILGCSASYFSISVSAEIDMTFTLFCAASIYCGYLSLYSERRYAFALGAGVLLACGFLTKGPQSLFFYGSGIGLSILLQLREAAREERLRTLRWLVLPQILAFGVFLCVATLWLSTLAAHVGWEDLHQVFYEEVIGRFVADPKADLRGRTALFYIFGILGAMLPWSPLLLIYAIKHRTLKSLSSKIPAPERRILTFSLLVIIPSLVVFSLSSGKSNRYLLPLYPFIAFLMAAAPRLLESQSDWKKALSMITAFMLMMRLPFAFAYAPYRNAEHSVKPIVAELKALTSEQEPLYVLELFDRWIVFYLTKDGRTVLRLTPQRAETMRNDSPGARIQLLLEDHYEAWRLEQVKHLAPSLKTVKTFFIGKKSYTLLTLDAVEAHHFKPKRLYPTTPSEPY